MSTEEFAPFESRGLGCLDSEPIARLDASRILGEAVTLTTSSSPRWISLFLLSGGVIAVICTLCGPSGSGAGYFLAMVPMLFLIPATMAAYFRLLLAGKQHESLTFISAFLYGFRRSVPMLATGVVLGGVCYLAIFLLVFVVALVSVSTSTGGELLGVVLSCVAMVASVYAALRWQLAGAVCMLEERSFFQVLLRSQQMTRGRVGSLTLINIGAGLLNFAAAMVVSVGATLMMGSPSRSPGAEFWLAIPTGMFYIWALMLPVTTNFLCYYYLRTAGQALDLPASRPEDPIGLTRS
ncbi:hypothetical protein IV102_30610 [bacterium]|nr:hypothetical protein [bacterium]